MSKVLETAAKSTKVFESSVKKSNTNYHITTSISNNQNDQTDSTTANSQFQFFKRLDNKVTDLYEFEQTIGQGIIFWFFFIK